MKKLKRTVKRGLSLSLALVMCIGMLQITALAESETIENEDGTTTVIDITEDIWENGSSKTETSVTTDADGNVLSESTTETTTETTTDEEGKTLTEDTTVSGSETSTENQGPTESTEEITGGASGEITVTPGGSGSIESNVSEALKPDTSGEEWTENDDGSHSKVEDVENGTSTTTVTTSKDDAGNDVYTTETVTTTTVTETIPFEAPEEGTTENEDGSRTTITVERDENGNVTGYVEVTEVRNAEGVVTSSVTKTVNHFGQATTTTKTTNTKTQVVAPDATSKIEVSVGEVTAGDGHGVLNTHGPDVDLGDFTPVDVDDLPDDAMVYVSGVGLRSKYEIQTILSTSAGALGGQTSSVYATQYAVTDKNGNVHVVYCADLSTPIDTIMEYYLTNTEDADYWTNNGRPIGDVNGGSHIRDIVSNGYWGTSEGTGSLDKMIQDLLDAKADGNEWLQNLTNDQIKGLDADLALAATQAAIWKYGNNGGQSSVWWSSVQYPVGDGGTWQWNPDTLTLTKETTVWDPEKGCNVIKTETKKFTIPSGLDAETMFKLETKPDGSQILTVPTFAQRYVHLVPENWLNGDTNNLGLIVGSDAGNKYSDKNQLAIAIFNYLTNLEQQKDTTTDLIQPSDIVEAVTNVKNTIRDEESDETKYEADVSFVLTVQPDRLNGDLLVHVYDAETGLILATRRVAGEGEEQMAGATQTENGMKYTIDGLVLANGQQVRINLVGSQAVEKGAYLITAKDGTGASQTFVGLEEGERGVDLNFTLQLDVTGAEVKTTESSKIEQNRTWTEETGVRYNYYTLDIDPGPGPGPDPTPTPTPDPDPDPDPDPSVEIPDPDVPLAEIPEEPVPTVEDPEIEIPEEDVPLADVPQTGDISLMWYAMTALAAAGLMVLSALSRKSRK